MPNSRALGVRFVLKGSVQSDGEKIRISAQMVDGSNGLQIWSEIFDGDSSNLFALQDRITGCTANSIGREIFVTMARDGEARNIDPNRGTSSLARAVRDLFKRTRSPHLR